MRKIILFIASSLDGKIALPDGGVDWLYHDEDYGFTEFYNSVDTVLCGRKTYEQTLTFEGEPFPEKQVMVFSRTRSRFDQPETQVIPRLTREWAENLLNAPGKDIWLVGGSDLIHSFLELGLIHEIHLSIHPVCLGQGIPLFQNRFPATEYTLLSVDKFDSGLVQIRYRLKND